MDWIFNYQLFLFDFDGLLVNTEELHFEAYRQMCAHYGQKLEWDWPTYMKAAHHRAEGLEEAIYAKFEELPKPWQVPYAKKKEIYLGLLEAGKVEMMPGATELLQALAEANIKRCVVTNSTKKQVDLIRGYLPILHTIPHFITREDYDRPKPDPQCYELALHRYLEPGERAIGFEDTQKGYKALLATKARAVLVEPGKLNSSPA